MAGRIPKVVVIGPAFVDMAIKCSQFPRPGETVEGAGVSCVAAGPGPNRAVEASFCDCQVHLISKVGDDVFGQMVCDNLNKSNVNTDFVYKAQALCTGINVTMVNSIGENTSCISDGANKALSADEVGCASVEQIIAQADVCLVSGPLPDDVVSTAVRTANLYKTKVILETEMPIQNSADLDRLDLPKEFYSVDILIPDLHNSALAADLKTGNVHELKLIASDLVARGIECVITKMGARGSFLASRDGIEQIHGFEVELVDHSGSADAFAGALAAAWGAKDPPNKAVTFAAAAGALACTKFGAQEALPTKQDILEFLLDKPD